MPRRPEDRSEAEVRQSAARSASGFWTRDLGPAHATAAVGGAAVAGWAMEFFLGGRGVTPPGWPTNAIFLGLFAGWLVVLSRRESRIVAWLGGVPFGMACLVAIILLGAIGGVVPQDAAASPPWVRTLGFDHVFSGPPFLLSLLLLMTNLGLATLRKVRALGAKAWFFSLNHAGLWIALAAGIFGAGDITRARTVLIEGQAEAMIVDAKGRHGYLPFGLFLTRFFVEPHPTGPDSQPGAPKQFVAEVVVLHKNQTRENVTIEVNRPLRRDGWTLYLTNYELSESGLTDQCLVEAVSDPWLPAVYAGIFLWLAGAVAMLFRCPFDQPGRRRA